MAVLQLPALCFKPLQYLVLIVIHGYIQTAGLELYIKRFMEDWFNWFGNADISVNIGKQFIVAV